MLKIPFFKIKHLVSLKEEFKNNVSFWSALFAFLLAIQTAIRWKFDPLSLDATITFTNFFNTELLRATFIAPVLEEIIFRGVIFRFLKIKIGLIFAVLLTSLLFAVGHLGSFGVFGVEYSAILLSILLCAIYLRFGLIQCILIHGISNFLGTVFAFLLFSSGILKVLNMDIIFLVYFILITKILFGIYRIYKISLFKDA